MNDTLLSSSKETAYRLLQLFSILEPKEQRSSRWISSIDFIAIYGKTFDIDDVNLHGGNWMKYAAYTPHMQLIDDALRYLAVRGLCQVSATPCGFIYGACERGVEVSSKFSTSYARQYKNTVEKALEKYGEMSELDLFSLIESTALAALRKGHDNG